MTVQVWEVCPRIQAQAHLSSMGKQYRTGNAIMRSGVGRHLPGDIYLWVKVDIRLPGNRIQSSKAERLV